MSPKFVPFVLVLAFCSVFAHAENPVPSADATIESVRERLKQLEAQNAAPAATPPPEKNAPPKLGPAGKSIKKSKIKADAVPKSPSKPRAVADLPPVAPPRAPNPQTPGTRKQAADEAHDEDEDVDGKSEAHSGHEAEIKTEPDAPEAGRVSGDWGGNRKKMEDHGIELGVTYKAEFNNVLRGGLEKEGLFLGNLDVRLGLDGEKLFGLKGTSAFLYVLGDHGGHPSENVGDVQGTSNIEAPVNTLRLYEAWLQQNFTDDKVSVLLGLHDLNSEFYATDTSGLFLNGSFGVGHELAQTGADGPSIFPNAAVALRFKIEPTKSFRLQTAAFDAIAGDPDHPYGTHLRFHGSDGLLLISEAAYLAGQSESKGLAGKYALGYWAYTKSFDHLTDQVTDAHGVSGPAPATSYGVYAMADQNVTENLAFFIRYGVASTATNPVRDNLSVGGVLTGPFPFRPKDRLGVGLTRVSFGPEYQALQNSLGFAPLKAESTFEFSYRIEVLPGLAVQPDVQYVLHPGTDTSIPNAWVGSLRLELNL